MKSSRRSFALAASVAVLVASTCSAGEHKDYPVTLKILETDAVSSKADGTRTTTSCTSSGLGEVTCDSRQVSAAQHTELVSFADASDGKLYMISCVQGVGGSFLAGAGQAMAANAGVATVSVVLFLPATTRQGGTKAVSRYCTKRTVNSRKLLLLFSVLPRCLLQNLRTRGKTLSPTGLWFFFLLFRRERRFKWTGTSSVLHPHRSRQHQANTPSESQKMDTGLGSAPLRL